MANAKIPNSLGPKYRATQAPTATDPIRRMNFSSKNQLAFSAMRIQYCFNWQSAYGMLNDNREFTEQGCGWNRGLARLHTRIP